MNAAGCCVSYQLCQNSCTAHGWSAIGLVELVDQMVPSQMELRPGLVVQAMVLDVLSGRTPLYRIEEFLTHQDVELLLGEYVSPHMFNDTNLARSLDALFNAGTSKIVTEPGIRATKAFQLDTTVPSYDTTSTSVWGDYLACQSETPPPGPLIVHGHSKLCRMRTGDCRGCRLKNMD